MSEKFHYRTESGAEIVLPRFNNTPVGVIRKLRNASDLDQAFGILEAVADEAALAEIDKLGATEFNAFASAWRDESQMTPGESSASSTS
jgi:hypothetical protein